MSTRHWAYPGGVGGMKASVALAEFSPDYPDPLLHCLWSDNGGVEHPRHRQMNLRERKVSNFIRRIQHMYSDNKVGYPACI